MEFLLEWGRTHPSFVVLIVAVEIVLNAMLGDVLLRQYRDRQRMTTYAKTLDDVLKVLKRHQKCARCYMQPRDEQDRFMQ